ncbi:MAG: sugar ABC transporter permease [Lachnospiraceae bacterium]|nr:sugar ABC transporter permease [Lachnospiraceae bacterium]
MNKKKKIMNAIEPYIWLFPSILLMAIFILIPIFEVFRISLSDVSRAGIIKGFAGLDNFKKVLQGFTFKIVLKNTLVWTVAVVGLSTLIGFILALVMNNQFRGRKIARAIVVFPWATSLIIQAGVWKFIIDTDYGALNTLLMKLGIIEKAINWTPTPAAYFAWECFVGIFVTVPFVMFCVLSGLQSIDEAYYEAARVDGATYWQRLFQITVPLVKPSLTVSTVLNIIYVFNSFPIIWTITKGDPANRTDTLVTYLYKLAFYNGKSGQAAAVSVIGFLILCACASVYMVISLRKEGGDE